MRTAVRALVVAAAVAALPGTAAAHGERAQEGFLRLRTVAFLDVTFEHDGSAVVNEVALTQGEDVVVTGTLKLIDEWPSTLARPRVAHIGLETPGPTMLLEHRLVNGRALPGSFIVEHGGVYEFRLEAVARRPGRWHLHPMMSIEGVGSLLGPGVWVEVEGSSRGFTNPVRLETGEVVDLETYGLPTVIVWHLVTVTVGLAWLLWWLRTPVLARLTRIRMGATDDQLVTRSDRIAGTVVGVAAAVVLVGGHLYTRAAYPVTIKQQVYHPEIPSLPQPATARVEVDRATYDPSTTTLDVQLVVSNEGRRAIRLSAFSTAYLTFSPGAEGVQVTPSDVVPAGESRALRLTISDHAWEEEALFTLRESQTTVGGVLVFTDDRGERQLHSIVSVVDPDFSQGA